MQHNHAAPRRWLASALLAIAGAAMLPGAAAAGEKHRGFDGPRHAAPLARHMAPPARHAAPQQSHSARPQPGQGMLWHGARPAGGHASLPARHVAPPMRHIAPVRHAAPPMRHMAPVRHAAPPMHHWQRGQRMPLHARRPVHDWRHHRLPPPPPGHQWMYAGHGYAQVALATGLITLVVAL